MGRSLAEQTSSHGGRSEVGKKRGWVLSSLLKGLLQMTQLPSATKGATS